MSKNKRKEQHKNLSTDYAEMHYPFFDEEFYLKWNLDVKEAKERGDIKSGIQHYYDFGEKESRIARYLPLKKESTMFDRILLICLITSAACLVALVASAEEPKAGIVSDPLIAVENDYEPTRRAGPFDAHPVIIVEQPQPTTHDNNGW